MFRFPAADQWIFQPVSRHSLAEFFKGKVKHIFSVPDESGLEEPIGFLHQRLFVNVKMVYHDVLRVFAVTDEISEKSDHPAGFAGFLQTAWKRLQTGQQLPLLDLGIAKPLLE